MASRDPSQPHRAASPLELFFDLTFVVAVSFAAANLHDLEARGHLEQAVSGYVAVFFAIWWAWVNFSWFATSFDTDDWLYRVTTIVQMAGVLIVAAGIGTAMQSGDFTTVTIGYVVMRLAMVSQWLRAARSVPAYRTTAVRYAVAISIVQVLWLLRLLLPGSTGALTFAVLLLAEVSVPIFAERDNRTPWHTHHISERYGLFTLIVLGEGVAAAARAVIDAIGHSDHIAPLLGLAAAGLVSIAGLWWIYFSREQHTLIRSFRSALTFGYGHYVVFAAAAALPAGLEVSLDAEASKTTLGASAVIATMAFPVAIFILAMWAISLRRAARLARITVPLLALAIAAVPAIPSVAPVVGTLLIVAVVVVLEVDDRHTRTTPNEVSPRGSTTP
jgi:low temperature requirement protein LtrA